MEGPLPESSSSAEEPLQGIMGSGAKDAWKQQTCERCGVSPMYGEYVPGYLYCKPCSRDMKKEYMEEAKKSDEEWQARYKAEEAQKKRKLDAVSAVITEFYSETMHCEQCSLMKKTAFDVYCVKHRGQIDAAVDQRLSSR
jgi:hypothetical protein